MELIEVFVQILPLFLLLFIGVIVKKAGLAPISFRKSLTDLCFVVLFPAATIKSFSIEVTKGMLLDSLKLILVGVVAIWAPLLLAMLIIKLTRQDIPSSNVYIFALMFNNIGFVGFGMTLSLYGSEGIFYLTMFAIAGCLSFNSFGIIVMQRGGSDGDKVSLQHVLLNPPIIGLVVAVPIMLFQIPLPHYINETVTMLSNCLAPLGMMVTGMSIADYNLRELLSGYQAFLISALRLLAIPAGCALIMRAIGISDVALATCTLAIAMPVAASCSLLAQKYDGNTKFAAQSVLISTLLSILTLPLIVYFAEQVV